MTRKIVDISELYGILKERSDCYIMCFDIVELMRINEEIGRAAGDKTIAECVRRIDEAASDNMLFFRIGGDEFVLVTDFESADDAAVLAKKITSKNFEEIDCDGTLVKVAMRVGITKVSTGKSLRYSELFTRCLNSIDFTRKSRSPVAVNEE